MKTDIILCACGSSEHQILIHHDPGVDDPAEVYLSIHLANSKSFWKRLTVGIKYIFGHRSRFGHWDEIILTEDHLPQLRKVVNTLKQKGEK